MITVTVLLAAMTALAGCSASMSPGAAARVDGTTISLADADRAADVFCQVALFSASQQGGGQVSNADARRQAVVELVSQVVAKEVAEREGLDIADSDWRFGADQRAQVEQALPDADTDEVVDVLEQGQYTYEVVLRLGEKATGEEATEANAAQLQEAGREVLMEAVAAADVTIDPRFGLGDDAQQVAQTGSLSVSSADLDAAPKPLPATQTCA